MSERARRKRRRLSRSGEFERVYREGRSYSSRHLVIYCFPRTDGDGAPRLGLSVGRKLGGAVERNRIKRQLREAFWARADQLDDGYDFVIVGRPAAWSWLRAASPHSSSPGRVAGGGRLVGRRLRGGAAAVTALRKLATAPVRIYQRAISPALPARCKYYPTCSEYAIQAVRQYGILRGVVLAAWRLLRCNPWSHGGVDFVEDQTLFRPRSNR